MAKKRFKRAERADGRIGRSFTVDGKRHFVYGYTEKELSEKENALRAKLAEKKDVRENPTLDQYHEKWNTERKCKESTLNTQFFPYANCANVVIKRTGERLGNMKMRDITADDIREVQRALEDRGVQSKTVNLAISHLSHIFHKAGKKILDDNPCNEVEHLPRIEPEARNTYHRALTVEETEAFFAAAEDSFYYDVFRFAANTGMRIGEIGALYLGDIRDGFIHVERTLTRNLEGSFIIGETPKTEKGRRTIPLNDKLNEIISRQKEKNRLLDGGGKITPMNNLLFKAPMRGLLNDFAVNKEIKKICMKSGVDKFTMHAFRATFATRCIEQGINPKTVQELLGHHDYSLTMNLYGHVMDATKKEAMDIMNAVAI